MCSALNAETGHPALEEWLAPPWPQRQVSVGSSLFGGGQDVCSVLHAETSHPAPKKWLAPPWPQCQVSVGSSLFGGHQVVCCVLHTVSVASSLFGGGQDVCSVLHAEAGHPELEERLVLLLGSHHLQKFLRFVLRSTTSCLGELEQHLHLAGNKHDAEDH